MSKLTQLEQHLKISFKNKNWLIEALTHRSYLNENQKAKQSNERLEFLGDALLETWVSEKLFFKFPDLPEGVLTGLRAAIVRTESLAEQARKLRLGTFLLLSKGEEEGGGRKNKGLLANCFEAIVGAIFCDQGREMVDKFLSQTISPKIKNISLKDLKDPKSLFQEIAQEKFRVTPTYKILKSEGPDHDKTFWAGVFVAEKQFGKGKGHSKQEAEINAAKDALNTLEKMKGKIIK